MSPLSPADVPRLRRETRFRVVGGQAVVIVQDSGEALVLNEVGSRILELADGDRSVGQIVEQLHREFEVGIRELTADVAEYLEQLVSTGVLEVAPSGREL